MPQRLPPELRPRITGFVVGRLVGTDGQPTWEPIIAVMSCEPGRDWRIHFEQALGREPCFGGAKVEIDGSEIRFVASNDAKARGLTRQLRALVDSVTADLVHERFSPRPLHSSSS